MRCEWDHEERDKTRNEGKQETRLHKMDKTVRYGMKHRAKIWLP